VDDGRGDEDALLSGVQLGAYDGLEVGVDVPGTLGMPGEGG
jgi:hypothetical protein